MCKNGLTGWLLDSTDMLLKTENRSKINLVWDLGMSVKQHRKSCENMQKTNSSCVISVTKKIVNKDVIWTSAPLVHTLKLQ